MTASHSPAPGRLDSIDLLRGIAMVLMLLDHARDVVGPTPYPTLALKATSVGYFMTRWITHPAAPAFILLAGVAAFLYEQKRGTEKTVRFLWTRGLWLIVLELTLVDWAWTNFQAEYFGLGQFGLGVIWVLGVGMLTLAALMRAPRWVGWTFSLLLILGHNSLDWIRPRHLGPFVKPFGILLRYATVNVSDHVSFHFTWPLIPWIAVLVLGYLIGPLFLAPAPRRKRTLVLAGWSMIVAFLVLRTFNGYGDPHPWSPQDRGTLFTVLSFLNLEKYPPSLLFLLMTLGIDFVLLAWFERARGIVARYFIAFGRVPLFFYLIHAPAIRLAGAAVSYLRYGRADCCFLSPDRWPQAYEPSLLLTYGFAIGLSLILLPVVRWFWEVKKARRHWWLAYL